LAAKVKRVLFAIVLLAVAVYVVDYVLLHLRHDPLGSVMVQRSYEVALKSAKTEYMRDDPRPVACVNSMLSHGGNPPCWYLVRHPKQIVKIGSVPNKYISLP
jgi:hypothetical protein